MTNKKLLENIIIDCEYYGRDKATIDIETIRSVLKDLDKLEEIRNTFRVEKEETINQNHYWLIVKKKPYYSYMITKEQYNNWKGWLKNGSKI